MASTTEQTQPPAYPRECPKVQTIDITVLHEPVEKTNITADLVFVHGLGGDPKTTWSKLSSLKGDEDAGPKRRKLNQKSKGDAQATSTCFWPWDLVRKDFDNLRIMTYGYDSRPSQGSKPANEITISKHARHLLSVVAEKRFTCQDRPLIFVAHSLGGIVVKGAFIESTANAKYTENEYLWKVVDSCTGIFFFATPHRGSQLAKWADIAVNFVKFLPFHPSVNETILQQLRIDSEILSNMERDFNDMRKNDRFKIYSFFETVPLSNIPLFGGLVVPEISASFNDREVDEYRIIANHQEMCQFDSEVDPAYQAFKAKLERNLAGIEKRKKAERAASLDAQNAVLRDTFDFDERHSRQRAIAHKLLDTTDETFEWIWDSDLVPWLQQATKCGHVFWITGKPASEKSSIMQFIASSEKTREHLSSLSDRQWTVIRHFFDFRAEKGINNNEEGFLRSLAAQLAKRAGDARINVSSFHELLHPDQHGHRPTSPISLPSLRQALINVLQMGGGRILVLLDGLDEFGGDPRSLVGFITQVASSRCRVCVASRPENPLPFLLKDFPSIEMQKHNFEAIKAYAHVRFGSTSADQDFCDLWAHRVAERAAGVFLWACFAIDEIIKADDNGLNPDSELMTRRLKAVPEELEGIYARKLKLLPMEDRAVAGLVLLLTAYCRKRRVSLHFLWQAIQDGPEGEDVHPLISIAVSNVQKNIKRERFPRYVNYCTSCFLYLQAQEARSRHPDAEEMFDVTYNHRTVKTYFEESGGPWLYEQATVQALGHHLWLLTCIQILTNANKQGVTDRGRVVEPNMQWYQFSSTVSKSDSLTYAMKYLPIHATLYELRSGASSFVLLHGKVTEGLMTSHEQKARDHSLHPYQKCSNRGLYFDEFGYYKTEEASDPVTFVELMVYAGANLFLKDYLTHEGKEPLLESFTMATPLGENLFAHGASVSSQWKKRGSKRAVRGPSAHTFAHRIIVSGQRERRRSKRTTEGPSAHAIAYRVIVSIQRERRGSKKTARDRSSYALALSSTTQNPLTPTGKELARRAALRTVFSDCYPPDSDPSPNHFLDGAKLAVSMCQRVEECDIMAGLFCDSSAQVELLRAGLSVIRPGRLQFKPHSHLIQTFDEASQRTKFGATTLGPFWAIGVAMWTLVPYDHSSRQGVFDLLFERGHRLHDVDGPYGTVWHSFITGTLMNWTEGDAPGPHFQVLRRNGADPWRRGVFGNALEFLWRVLHSSRTIESVRNPDWNEYDAMTVPAYGIEILKHLLDLGVPNEVVDPNGRVPSLNEMRRFAEIEVEDSTESKEKILFASFRHYYGENFVGAVLAERLLSMSQEEFDQHTTNVYSRHEDEWTYHRPRSPQAGIINVSAVEKEMSI